MDGDLGQAASLEDGDEDVGARALEAELPGIGRPAEVDHRADSIARAEVA